MNERVRRRPRDDQANPPGLGDLFPSDGGVPGTVTVTHGPYAESLSVAGMRVQAVRDRYRDRFDIDPRSQAILDGNPVGDDTLIATGQTLSFITRAGEKGAFPSTRRAYCPRVLLCKP